jgi:hypothetical protein
MSKFQVNDTTYIEILFEDQDIPGQPDLFEEIAIIENATQLVPVMNLTLNDSQNDLVKSLHLSDGFKVSARISQGPNDKGELSDFRIFSGDTIRNGSQGHFNTFSLVLDVPQYLGKTAFVGLKGTTSEVMQRIATDCGLVFKGDSTNDKQIWLSGGMTYNQWARHVSKHGYISDTSCMYFAVNEKKELLYKDLTAVLSGKASKRLVSSVASTDSNDILIQGNRSHTASGLLNNWINYGYIARKDGITGSETFTKVTVQKRETALAQSADVRDLVTTARIDMLPFNCGNTYENYEKAFYQNFRLRCTYTESMSVMVYGYTDINLLDAVEVVIGHGVGLEDRTPTVKSGYYIVIAKTKIIRGGTNYGERLELIRNSTRHTGINTLVT